MTLSSADNPLQTVLTQIRGYDKLKLKGYFFNFGLIYMTLSSADSPFKQFGPRSGSTFCQGLIQGSKLFDILEVMTS